MKNGNKTPHKKNANFEKRGCQNQVATVSGER